MTNPKSEAGVIALINDLIFETKLRSSAKSLGVAVEVVKSTSALLSSIQKSKPSLVIIDLNNAPEADAAIKSVLNRAPTSHVVAYVSHVDEELAESARRAGAHEVMPRSQFNQQLPQLLQTHGGRSIVPDPAI